ncbi:MAG: CHASE domain-containing protein [Tepidisphaeraceae bacterium]
MIRWMDLLGSRWALPLLLLVVGLGTTATATIEYARTAFEKDQNRFDGEVRRRLANIADRMALCESLLRGVAGLRATRSSLDVDTFHNYIVPLDVAQRYPGSQGIGFAIRTTTADGPELLKLVRPNEARPVRPARSDATDRFPIVLLEPMDRRNTAAIGYDMFSEPLRREAMERARDRGEMAISAAVTLVQEVDNEKQPGFLMFFPVYKNNTVPASIADRREQLAGFAYSPFRAGDLFDTLLPTGSGTTAIAIDVDDGSPDQPGDRLYRSKNDATSSDGSALRAVRPLTIGGRTWTVRFRALPDFYSASSKGLVPVIAIVGSALSFLISILVYLQGVAQTGLERSQERLREALTDAEQTARRERAARDESDRNSRLKDEFLATLSHELRTPLNAILGWAQLLVRKKEMSDEQVGSGIETIYRNAKAQAQLIDDLLDMSRIISGKIRLDVRPCRLADVAKAAVEAVQHAADAKGITLTLRVDSDIGPVAADANRIQQVIWNLVSNAIKFTPRGGHIELVIQCLSESMCEVVVRDDGQGIAPDFLPYVFDKFRQADASLTRQHGGLGLGLAIVKQLVELHGGTVRAESDGLGMGATFRVLLPVMASVRPERAASAPGSLSVEQQGNGDSATARPAARPLDGVRVLAVDDEPDARELIRRILEDAGARTTVAASAEAAQRELDQGIPDVLLSDIGMPGTDGLSLLKDVRCRREYGMRTLPAVALTAFARDEDRRLALEAGYADHVAKPFDADELVRTLLKVVRKKSD